MDRDCSTDVQIPWTGANQVGTRDHSLQSIEPLETRVTRSSHHTLTANQMETRGARPLARSPARPLAPAPSHTRSLSLTLSLTRSPSLTHPPTPSTNCSGPPDADTLAACAVVRAIDCAATGRRPLSSAAARSGLNGSLTALSHSVQCNCSVGPGSQAALLTPGTPMATHVGRSKVPLESR